MSDSSNKKRKARGSLNKGLILEAAQSLLREQGIGSLSIRKIANQLNAGTMSIYNHYANKQEIIVDLVAAFIYRAHEHKAESDDWKDWAKKTFTNIYNASVSEPEYLTLMINDSNIGMASLDIFENALTCLINADFSPQQASLAFHQLLSFTLGAAMLRVNLLNTAGQSGTQTREPLLSEAVYPLTTRYWQTAHPVMQGSYFEEALTQTIKTIDMNRVEKH